jgi:hypothetical protein
MLICQFMTTERTIDRANERSSQSRNISKQKNFKKIIRGKNKKNLLFYKTLL